MSDDPAITSEPSLELVPYLPRMVIEWAVDDPGTRWREVEGSLVFADLSGFTKMSERLSRLGKMGAEEVTDAINTCFTELLGVAYDDGGGLVKFGGDALLLVFTDEGHVERATRSAVEMRARLRTAGRIATSAGQVTLRMSVGIHSGSFHCFLVGGDTSREFLLTGPGASEVIAMEHDATAGQILVSRATADALPAACLGEPVGAGVLLSRAPPWPPPLGPLVVPPLRGADLTGFVPEAVCAHVLDGGGEPQHRTVTVGFVHFDGLDRHVTDRGADATADALERLVSVVQDACARYEVAVLATDVDADGGKFVLAAGAPRARGDDDARMLGAARAIVDAGTQIPVRIGVHRGPVFTGDVGPAYRRTYTVMGDTVNLAARLMAAADPGHILCTAVVLDHAPAFHGLALAPLHVKGKRAAVEAFDVGAARDRGAHLERDGDRRALPFVGRAAELHRLVTLLDDVRTGSGRGAHVLGPPGTGKTRLVAELRAQCPDVPAATTVCEPYEASTPYAPMNVLIHDALGLTFDDEPAAVTDCLEERVRTLVPSLLPWLPLLGVPLELDLPETDATRSLAPQFRPARVAEVTVDFLQALLAGPRLVVFEDTQWMDEASRELLDRAIARAADGPWMILCTGYEDAEPFDGLDVLNLMPLGAEDATDALRRAAAARPLRRHEIEAIVARADGSPLFLSELFAVAGERGSSSLPESVEGLVTTQIDRLPPRRRTLLSYAAVLGRSFAISELASLIGAEAADTGAQNVFGLSDFIDFDAATSRCRFRHGLLRDTAYEMLSYRRRRELHERVARMLESALGEHPELEAELLSLHYLHARSFPEAWHFARLAGDRARDKYANVDAAVLYERALSAARALPEVGAIELATVWEALGDVRERSGEYDDAVTAYRTARRLVRDDPIREAGVLLKVAWIPERVGRYSDAVRWIRKGQRIVEGLSDAEAARRKAQLAAWYAAIRQAQGRSREAVTWCRIALDEAAASQDLAAEAHASFILDWAYVESGHPELATHSVRALEIYEELGNLNAQASVLNNMGGFAYYDGRWNDAVALYIRARDAYLQAGNATDAATGITNIAEVLGDQGRLVEAREQLADALHAYRAAGYRWGIACATRLLGRSAARAGEFDEAHRLLGEARESFRAASLDSDVTLTDAWIAEAFVLAGDAGAALAQIDTLLHRAGDGDTLGVIAPLLERVRGLARMQQGDPTAARAALDASVAAAQARGADYEVALSLRELARVNASDGCGDVDTPASEASGIFDRLGVQHVAEAPLLLTSETGIV